MTHTVRRLFAVLALVALCIPVLAQAEWVQKEIKWSVSGVTGDGTGIYIRDTLKRVIGTTIIDTTGWFTLKDAQPLPRGIIYPANGSVIPTGTGATGTGVVNDTTIAGYLVFQSDSTAAPTATVTSLTCIIDGRVGAYGPATAMARGWVKFDSVVVTSVTPGTTGLTSATDESIAIPIRTIGVYGSVFKWAQLRARLTTGTGNLSACRAFVRYWRNAVTGTGIE